jgi:hypothetical protein
VLLLYTLPPSGQGRRAATQNSGAMKASFFIPIPRHPFLRYGMTMKAICSRPSVPTAYRTTLSDKKYLFRAPDENEEDTEALLDCREALVVGLGLLSTILDYNFFTFWNHKLSYPSIAVASYVG